MTNIYNLNTTIYNPQIGTGAHKLKSYHTVARNNFNPKYKYSPISIGIEIEGQNGNIDLSHDELYAATDGSWLAETDSQITAG